MTTLLQDYVTRAAEKDAGTTAVVMGSERLTYGELEQESNRLARLLREQGLETGDRVCLFTEKSPAAILAMLGVLKAGGAYVPVDVDTPAARVALVVEAADPRMVLTAPAAESLLEELTLGDGVSVAPVDAPEDRAAFSPEPLAPATDEQGIAHVLFTSGSTGVPKGVVIEHRNVTAFVEWARSYFGIRAGDRNSGHPPLHFDLSTFDIYGTFSAAAELHLVPAKSSIDPRGPARFIRDSELTQWFSVPSVLTYMAKFDAVEQDDFPSLERLLWCGEVLPTPVLVHWMERLPHVRFTNLYGPTEATIASSYHTVDALPQPTDPVPIGAPCEGEELLVLDEELRPVPEGEIGDLYISGVGLSPGYWRDPEKTAEVFLDDPRPGHEGRIYKTGDLARVGEDGLVYFLGRADSQIKSRGYRIELGEIEAALSALSAIRECAVVGVDTGGFEGTTICCAYSTVNGEQAKPEDVGGELRKLLPAYMIPRRWEVLDALPKNVNGKIDRKLLRDRFAES